MAEEACDAMGGVRRLEGYLLWQAEIAGARRAATAFADQLPWLTTAQREALERAYVQEQLHSSQRTIAHIARRCRTIRGEYEARYRRLRLRAAALCLGAIALAAAASALVTIPSGRW